MKHLELHILQSVPVTCLNRDDLGSPKTAFFGGVQRARVSSQSWKRAIREYANEINPFFKGKRTRLIIEPLFERIKNIENSEQNASKWVNEIADYLASVDTKDAFKVKTMFFTSQAELDFLAHEYVSICREKGDIAKDSKDYKKKVKKRMEAIIKKCDASFFKDAADISLFGRMVANDHSMKIEGATMFNHPISTHKVDNELDFFTAVDEWQKGDDSGAGMTGTLEFNASVYYRFAALNLDMLADENHLNCMTVDERKKVVEAFVKATIEAVPGMGSSDSGRKHSMNGYTRPSYVLGIVREKGHPIQLVNAFEMPIWTPAGKSIMAASIEAIKKEEETMNKTWKLDKHQLARVVIPDKDIEQFIGELIPHVH